MNRPIHVCLMTSAHPVDDVRLREKVVASLLASGFRVTWVGPDYRYVAAESNAAFAARKFEYRLYPPPAGRLARLVGRRLRATAAAVPDVDVYFAPEPDSARSAVTLARRKRVKVIFDIHELYDQSHVQNWAPPFARPFAGWLVRRLISRTCARCDLVTGVSEGVLAPYRQSSRQSILVRNCAPLWFAGDSPVEVCALDKKVFRIMHGKSTAYNGTSALLRGIALCLERVPDLRVVLFKWFDRNPATASGELDTEITSLGVEDAIELRQPVTMQEMPSVLRTCDVGTIAHGRLLEAGTQPNRLYEYMAVGLPIVAPSYDKGIAPVIESEGCGLLADFEDPRSIANAIVYLRDNPEVCRELGRRGRDAFLARHNWEAEVRPLIDTIRDWFPGRGGE
jgi:glycosyltransferase involved in cell wall biosynthesis